MQQNDYDAFAAAYDADNESNAWNALYERPAVLRLAGDVSGLRVLDAGCGGGAHAAELVNRGADVVGIDSSAALLRIAERRLGGRGTFLRADLAEPLPFEDGSFDLVLSSLVLHYLEDWTFPLSEFHRVLRPRGRLVFSTHHPFMDHALSGHDNYFETYCFADSWEKGGRTISLKFWHRPLRAIVSSLGAADFSIHTIDEPDPEPAAAEKFPQAFRELSTKPRFIFFAATKV